MPDFAALLHDWIAAYGIVVVFVVVMMESAGVPMPGETALVSAAIYAGTTHRMNPFTLIAAAAAAAIIGDNIGYFVGRRFGFRLLLAHGHRIGLTQARLKMGQYLFLRHGGKIVFFGRFIAFLRTFAAVLAGVNLYAWRGFLLYNALGGICWALLFGVGGYLFGRAIETATRPLALVGLAGAVVAMAAGSLLFRRFEARWLAEAERALPGPLAERV
jgi:membrane protein DedA with SNARE-associated domain